MPRPFQIRPVQLKKNVLKQFCEECDEEATKEALFELQQLVRARKLCDKCLMSAEYEIPLT